jgi:hypothetical protein
MPRHLARVLAALCAPAVVLAQPLSPAPQPGSAPALDLSAPRALLVAAVGDPEITDVQAAAAREAERGVPDAGSYPSRARLAALLPRITAEVRREEQSNRVVGLQGAGEVDYLRLAPGSTVLVRASWDLGQLVAAPGELQAATQAAARSRRRAEAISQVTRLHFERRRARVALLLDPPADPVARAQAELEVERLGAEIDALTGGLVSGRLQ